MPGIPETLAAALVDRYEMQNAIGSGGMADVYLARDRKLDRPVAIKVFRPELAAAMGTERFLREIEIAAHLTHPHILPLHDSGEAAGFLYYVMPYIEGESLRDRLDREKQLPVEDALQIAREVAAALSYAHSHGVVHRDIKPENVLLAAGTAVVSDFGIARAITAAGGDRLTATGIAVGTPLYMSPEQATGSDEVDGRSDVYSLGCLLYEMLAGKPPFQGATAASVVQQQLSAPPPDVTSIREGTPPPVAAAIARALTKTPADRFRTASEFAQAIRPTTTPPASPVVENTERGQRRSPMFLRWVAGVAVAAAAVLAVMVLRNGGPTEANAERPRAGWTVITDFEGSADSTTRGLVRDYFKTALDESPVVTTLSAEDVRTVLRRARFPDTTRVTLDVGREIALRLTLPVVVTGRVDRLGSSYTISWAIVEPDSGRTILTRQAVAESDDAVMRTLAELSRGLVEGFVDSTRVKLRPDPFYNAASSTSLEAVRAWRRTDPREAMRLDSTFALAYWYLGVAASNAGDLDSARFFLEGALKYEEHLSEATALGVRGLLAVLEWDVPRAASLMYQQRDASGGWDVGNLATVLWDMGRWDETLEQHRLAHLKPVGPGYWEWGWEAIRLAALGRMEEAETELRDRLTAYPDVDGTWEIPGSRTRFIRLQMLMTTEDWATAEGLARNLAGDLAAPVLAKVVAARAMMSLYASRGELSRAVETLDSARQLPVPAAGGIRDQLSTSPEVVWLWKLREEPIPGPPLDSVSPHGKVHLALRAVFEGDTAAARDLLAEVRALPRRAAGYLAAAPDVVEAHIRAAQGDWDWIIATLTPMQAWRVPHIQVFRSQRLGSLVLWSLAEAHEQLGQLDSATAYYERLTDPVELNLRGEELNRVPVPFARQRLIVLYSRMGRVRDAQRHWEIFSRTFTNPDPELVHLVDEAREALVAAGGRS